MSDTIVFLSLPCTNNDVHMGHLSGVHIPGDVYARYQALCGKKAITVCGADQNNTYVQAKALKENISFEEAKKLYADKIRESLKLAGIHLDYYTYTNSSFHKNSVQKIAQMLQKNKAAKIVNYNHPYCEHCQQYLADLQLKGTCQNCQSIVDGGLCEQCCMPIHNQNLNNPQHSKCSLPITFRKKNTLAIDLQNMKNTLQSKIENSDWENWLKTKTVDYLHNQHFNDLPLTNFFTHGNPAGIENLEAKHLAIWHEAVWGGITALMSIHQEEPDKLIERLNNNNSNIVPFLGQDNEFIYTVNLSATLIGLGFKNCFPYISVQRFIKLNKEKFSSSRNHLIYLQDLLKDYDLDIIRLYSLSILNPYHEDSNNFNTNDLAKLSDHIESLKQKISHLLKNKRSKLETKKSDTSDTLLRQYHKNMSTLQFKSSYQTIIKQIEHLNHNWESDTIYADTLTLIIMLKPIMPKTIDTIQKQLDIENSIATTS